MISPIRRPAPLAALALLLLSTGCLSGSSPTRTEDTLSEQQTVSIVINNLGLSFPDGLDENNNPYLRYIEQSTGLDLQVVTPPPEVYEERLDVIMSSGKLPDMLHTYEAVWFDHYLKQDAFLPLDELLAAYGPHLLEKIPDELWDRVRHNGRIYAVPSLNEVIGTELMYARKDWLDRLGLEPPETLEAYYEVIRAFTLDDPDGNGRHDTIGLTMMVDLNRSSPFFGAFGTQLNTWFERDGQLVHGSLLPETKKALAYLARLYNEKLLDQEFPLNLHSNLYEKVENGTVGLFSAAWYDTRGPIAANKRRDPEAEWIKLAYPAGPDGARGVEGKDRIRGYNVIPAGTAHPERVIRMLDFIVDDYKNLKLGFEDEIWRMENGRMVTDFDMHDKHLYRGIYQSLVDVPDPDLFKQRLDSLGDFNLYDNLMTIHEHVMPGAFYGVPTPSMSKYDKPLSELHEVLVRIIMGIEPIDAFDQFVLDWKRLGGDEITEEVNDWYRKQQQWGGS
ncbi:extracellular solute-binding protein [Paenibacillus sp. 1P07SE]|uniref:extracellular solute-binding protein n=1 Tax=Paenibacillus sp. 1P07SE TaxID=3132209 RepID=UPI0039A43DC7